MQTMSLNFDATLFRITQDSYGFLSVKDVPASRYESFYIVIGGKFVDKSQMINSEEWFSSIDDAMNFVEDHNNKLIEMYNERAYLVNRGNTMLEQKYV